MAKQIGRVTYEGRFVIVTVPDDWTPEQPLPEPGPTDLWFTHRAEFVAVLGGAAYDRNPINRQPWSQQPLKPAITQPLAEPEP
jgi:hypothetical protein